MYIKKTIIFILHLFIIQLKFLFFFIVIKLVFLYNNKKFYCKDSIKKKNKKKFNIKINKFKKLKKIFKKNIIYKKTLSWHLFTEKNEI